MQIIMGKHERGTPKDIANRIKSKGLQKLRWFCQMCQKQCRDQNGFKCHLTSESHQRQLLLVAENTNSFLRQFSRDFEANFMQILKTCFGTKRVRANEVYQEYIKDKGHVHMNATVWHTLTGFVLYLGKSGKCKIDQNEKGWYIQYIDQEEVIRKAEEAKRMKAEKDDEERQQEMINAQVRRALEQQGEVYEPQATELMRSDDSEKITLNLNLDKKPTAEDLKRPVFTGVSIFEQIKTKKEEPASDEDLPSSSQRDRDREERRDRRDRDTKKEHRSRSRSRDHERDRRSRETKREHRSRSRSHDKERDRRAASSGKERPSTSKKDEKPKKSALDEIREQQEWFKEKKNRKDHWLHEGIIVKIITKKLGDDYYKAKGVVKSLIDDYTASVKLDDGTLVKLDQAHVETVIPNVGREMKIVNGAYRGCVAKLESLDQDAFCLNLRISEGPMNGRTVRVPYEDASKLA
uniref:Kin17_mid domain-containing protein n=1 Tax=Haemonchus contortus TaxID=6289 RepID=A0A7I4YFB2_HAECO